MTAALLLAAAIVSAQVAEVRLERVEPRTALVVTTTGELGEVGVSREGLEVVVRLGAPPAEGLVVPEPVSPVELVRVDPVGEAETVIRMVVPPELGFEVQREGPLFRLLFDPAPHLLIPQPSGKQDLADLYPLLFPVAALGGAEVVETPGAAEGEELGEYGLGPLRVRPGLEISYIDGTTAVDSPTPVEDTYWQLQPLLDATLESRYLTLRYEPRFRTGSQFKELGVTSHLASADARVPLGAYSELQGRYQYTRGLIETTQVDPAREYFFDLGRYIRHEYGAGVRFDTGGGFDGRLGFDAEDVNVDSDQFFDYQRRLYSAELGRELGARLRGSLHYVFEDVPASVERPEAETSAHRLGFGLDGDILPLLRSGLLVGYEWRKNPQAGDGGETYSGLSLRGFLERQFTPASRLRVDGLRSTNLSAYERNGFYVATGVRGELTLGLPFEMVGRIGAGHQRNDYRVPSVETGEKRRDDITGWSVGLGRGLTRWAFLRFDYVWEKRNSTIDLYDVKTHALQFQLGIGTYQRRAW